MRMTVDCFLRPVITILNCRLVALFVLLRFFRTSFAIACPELSVKYIPNLKPGTAYSLEPLMNISQAMEKCQLFNDNFRIPNAYENPAMLVDPANTSRIIMTWRSNRGHLSQIHYQWLDRSYNIVKQPDMIEEVLVLSPLQRHYLYGEDPRLYLSNGQLRIIYNLQHKGKYKQVYRADLLYHEKLDMFYTPSKPVHITIEQELGFLTHQKNWSPLQYCPGCPTINGDVSTAYIESVRAEKNDSGFLVTQELYVYSLFPHRIVVSRKNVSDPTVEIASTVSLTRLLPKHKWMWGEMRGGTPALAWNNSHYLSFFHSSGTYHHKWIITYVIGAYMFESSPPFAITHISRNPFVQANMINESFGWTYKAVDYVMFPMSFILDGDEIHLCYGHNDNSGNVAKLNRTVFLDNMELVESEVLGDSEWEGPSPVPNSFKLKAN